MMKHMKDKTYKAVVISESNQRVIKQLAKRDGRSFAREAGIILEFGIKMLDGGTIDTLSKELVFK